MAAMAPPPATPAVSLPGNASDLLAEESSRVRHRGLLWLVAAAFFMQALDSTIVNTAVPAMATALGVTPLGMRSALTSYVLTLAVLIPASPWLCDRFGTRRVFAAAIAVFGIGSLLCGISQTLPELVAARVIQGVGGASLMPVGRYVLVRTIDKREYIPAMSTVATFGLLGSVLGPLMGGLLVEFTSWRLIFLINVPVGIAGLWMNQRDMPDYRLEQSRRFDVGGFLLFAAASALLLVASEQAGAEVHHWALIAGSTALAVVMGALYVWHSRRTEYPVADLTLLRVRSLSVALVGNLFTRLGIGGMFLLLVLFLQVGCGWSPTMAGLMMVPQALGSISSKWVVNRLLLRLGYRRLLIGNTTAVAVMLAAFALVDGDTPTWLIGVLVYVYGCFTGLQYTTMNTLAYTDVDVRHASMASSMASTTQYLSISFGIAFASLLMEVFVGREVHAAHAYVAAFHITVLVLAAVTAMAATIFLRLRPDHPGAPARAGTAIP